MKRLTKEYSDHMRRVQEIEEEITNAISPEYAKIEVLKALHNVTLDLFSEYVTGIYRVYEDE